MTANVRGGGVPFPRRGDQAGCEPWEKADHLEELAWRAEAEEGERRLAAAVLRSRRRMQSEQRRQAQRQRNRR